MTKTYWEVLDICQERLDTIQGRLNNLRSVTLNDTTERTVKYVGWLAETLGDALDEVTEADEARLSKQRAGREEDA